MKFLVLSENSNGSWPYLYFRGIGAQELHKRIQAAGYESTVIDWFTHWSETQLISAAELWFGDEPEPVIAISTPFNTKDVFYLESFLTWAKTRWPSVTVIHGGGRVYDPTVKHVDVFFLGRSMQIFDDWLHKRDLASYTVQHNPMVLKNLNFDQYRDVPVVPSIDHSDCYTSDDILGFEIGVGCKFNCTFCNYELRGAKISNLTDSESLHNFFLNAYTQYGIENFFIADDTPNESDVKLEILANAIQGLPFRPKLSAFTRLDILAARPQQIEYYKKIQFDSLFFGIESFNDQASRGIRKKSDLYNVYDTLKLLREISPNTFLVGGLIVGLNGDSESSIRESVDKVITEQLLDSVQLYPLLLLKAQNAIMGEGYRSELELDPERFGYKLTGETLPTVISDDLVHIAKWVSDWIDYDSAVTLADTLAKETSKRVSNLNHMEYAGLRALNLVDKSVHNNTKLVDLARKRAYTKSNRLKQIYAQNKMDFFRTYNEKNSTCNSTGTV